MTSKIFLWLEDHKGKASYTFWQNMMEQLYPQIVVESKKNNSELVKDVKALSDTSNQYIIVFDNSFDNPQVVMEQKILKQCVQERENVILFVLFVLSIYCWSLRT